MFPYYQTHPFYHVSKGVKEQTLSQKLLWIEGSAPLPIKDMSKHTYRKKVCPCSDLPPHGLDNVQSLEVFFFECFPKVRKYIGDQAEIFGRGIL